MDDKAHTILSEVIASHGERLTVSTAFCKVYLAGYLADYSEEKELLVTLKSLELPAALVAYTNAEISEASLFDCIQVIRGNWGAKVDDLAWGVDAWAAASGINGAMRCTIRQHCFPIMPAVEPVIAEVAAPSVAAKSRLGFGARLMANVAGVFGLMMLQVFGSNMPSSPLVLPMTLPPQAPVAEKPPALLIDIPLLSATLEIVKPAPYPLVKLNEAPANRGREASQAVAPYEYQQKSQRLLAETESFLRYGN